MYIKNSFLFLLIVFTAQLFAQKEITYSDASASSVIIDGNASDWRQPFRYYDGSSKLEFSFRNDSQYLFLCIKTSDEIAQIKMLNAGLEFSVNTSKKTYASISFPLQRERNSSQPPELLNRDKQQRSNQKEMKRLMVAEIKTMKLKGFKNLPDGIYSIQIQEGIKTAIGIDSLGLLTAEYQIPFNLLFLQTDTVKPITASITLNGMDIPGGGMRPPMGNGQMPSRPPGGGMPPGGMGGGGMGGGEMDGSNIGSMNGNMRGSSMGGNPMGGGQNGPPPGFASFSNDNVQDKTIKLKLKLAIW